MSESRFYCWAVDQRIPICLVWPTETGCHILSCKTGLGPSLQDENPIFKPLQDRQEQGFLSAPLPKKIKRSFPGEDISP